MCSQYTIQINTNEIKSFPIDVGNASENIDLRLLPSQMAPVVVNHKGLLKLTAMKFSLIPSWSAEPKVKFATHNTRIETASEKPTWKNPFLSQHCVVPLTCFFESVYKGPEAGHIIKFSQAENHILWAAAVFDYWKHPTDSKQNFFSFAILTQEPSPYILEHGHDRTPIFIKPDYIRKWLELINLPAKQIREELLANSYHPDLKIEVERPLKAGWEKRK